MRRKFETDRLILRSLTPDDWRDFYEYESMEETLKFVSPGWKCTEEDAKAITAEWSENETVYAVCLKSTGKMIGHIDIRPEYEEKLRIYEIGYIFSPVYQGKGYAAESLRRLIQYGFEDLKAHRIIADSYPENTASWRLLERLGFRREGHFIKAWPFESADNKTIWKDVYIYGILESEWALIKHGCY